MRRVLSRAPILAVAALSLAMPAGAAAADFYVDKETGLNTNDCSTPALACDTISMGVTIATNAGMGHTVHVDDNATPYSENSTTIFNGVSVIGEDFVGGLESGGRPIAQPAAAQGQLFLVQAAGSPGSRISGFRLQPNDQTAINVQGAMAAIEDNVLEDPSASGNDTGITLSATSPTVSDNLFTDLLTGINLSSGSAQITGNEFSGSRGPTVLIVLGSPTLTANFFHDPGGPFDAVKIGGANPVTRVVAATLRRNRIFDAAAGVTAEDTLGPISFDGDLIVGATAVGIGTTDSNDNGDSDVTATNVTIVSAGTATSEISSTNGQVTLDSSILGDKGIDDMGTASCSISFSRGPTTGAGCDNFQTTADPMFASTNLVNPLAFHLLSSSPMIDAGNPAAPSFGLDLDGDARAIDGNCDGTARRDIGADEFVSNCPPPPASPATPAPTPAQPAARKKCKKGRKLKKGKCVKKKKRKK